MNEEQKIAYTEVDSFDDAAITLRRKELKHQFETFQVRHLTNYTYVQAMWLKTLDRKLAEKDSRIVELEARPRAADKIAIIALRNLEGIFKELEIAKDEDGIIRVVKLDFPKCQRLIKDAIVLLIPPVAASEAHVAAVIKQWEKANPPG